MNAFKKMFRLFRASKLRTVLLRVSAGLMAAWGIYAAFAGGLFQKMSISYWGGYRKRADGFGVA